MTDLQFPNTNKKHKWAIHKRSTPSFGTLLNRGLAACSLTALLLVGGCGYSGFPLGTTTAPVVAGEIGNWQIQAASTAGTSPFSALAGWIDEPKSSSATTPVTVDSVFQVTPDKSTCFTGATTLPSEGTLTGTSLGLNGFGVNLQFVSINATQDSTATHLNGTYAVSGGCAGGASGTVTGTRYDPLSGTYQGTLSGGQGLTIISTQGEFPNGTGHFPMSGTVAISGSSCLTSATIDPSESYVIGSAVSLSLTSGNLQLLLRGTFTPDATSITVSSITVLTGTCSVPFGLGTLSRQ